MADAIGPRGDGFFHEGELSGERNLAAHELLARMNSDAPHGPGKGACACFPSDIGIGCRIRMQDRDRFVDLPQVMRETRERNACVQRRRYSWVDRIEYVLVASAPRVHDELAFVHQCFEYVVPESASDCRCRGGVVVEPIDQRTPVVGMRSQADIDENPGTLPFLLDS